MESIAIHQVISLLQQHLFPGGNGLHSRNYSPFKLLISTMLSARTKDETTGPATDRLFALATTPQQMLCLNEETIATAIYPVGFYNTKARNILTLCRQLLDGHQGRVPETREELVQLKGIGRKTANLVLALAYDQAAICVDTHVHRISNRWGYVATRTPAATELALEKKLPLQYWKQINQLLVTFGKSICRPVGPKCSRCYLTSYCDRVGVTR